MRLFNLCWLFLLWLNMDASLQQAVVKCTVPDIDNGYVPGGGHAQRVYNEHEILHFACNDRYKRAEDRPSKCTKIGEKAEFSPTPACEQIKCKLDQMTPTGTTYEPAYRNTFLPGETLTVGCGDDYYFSHFRETSAEVSCKEDGQWTVRPICKEVICDRRHPHVKTWTVYWGQIKLREITGYTCDRNYKKTNALGRATCTRDGWMPNPLCEEIKCDRVSVENAVIVGDKWEYKNGQKATYRCKEGYKGNPTRTCGEHGWSGHSQCTEMKCSREDVRNADIVGNKVEYKYKEKAYYRCHKGFTGKPTRTCWATGWSGQTQCEAVTCGKEDFDYAASGDRRRSSYNYGEEVEYTCINGHEGSFTRTCGENGWTGSTSCSTCPKPKVDNGIVLLSSTDPNTVHYACNKGFKRFTKGWWGEANCKGREWVGLQPCIEEEKCGEIPAIPNGAMSRRQTRVYENGQRLWIDCKRGYRPQVELLTCQEGNWTSSASSLETICASVSDNCKPPPVVENAVVETPYQDEYARNSEVIYKCRDNYTIKGKNRLVCRSRNWDESNIKCSGGCEAPPPLEDGDIRHTIKSQYNHYETVEYQCQAYYTMEGEPFRTCISGEWTGYVRCLKPCIANEGNFRQHNITLKSHGKRFFKHDEMMEFRCARGRPVGAVAMHQRCNGGVILLPTCH